MRAINRQLLAEFRQLGEGGGEVPQVVPFGLAPVHLNVVRMNVEMGEAKSKPSTCGARIAKCGVIRPLRQSAQSVHELFERQNPNGVSHISPAVATLRRLASLPWANVQKS